SGPAHAAYIAARSTFIERAKYSMSNKLFLQGFGLSVAAAVAIYIADGPTLVALAMVAVVALGWAVVLCTAQRRALADQAQRAAEARQRVTAIAAEAERALSECTGAFGEQCSAVKTELTQLEGILADAIAKLVDSFNSLHSHSVNQQNVAVAITRGELMDGR